MKTKLLETLNAYINQRPGLDPRNYIRDWRDADGIRAYRAEAKSITRDLEHARALIRYVERRDSISAADILKAAQGSRLRITETADGYALDYITGQYWPTEYRRAVGSVMARAIWDRLLADSRQGTGEDIRAAARRELGVTLANRFFN